jgi:HAD superfamily hydrolase (TIGR01509 family)
VPPPVPDASAAPRLAIIFDFDGVIVDSETPEFESHRHIFAQHDLELTRDEWCRCVGLWKAVDWFQELTARGATGLSEEAFLAEKRRLSRSFLRMEPLPGIAALLEALTTHAVPTAVASTSPATWVLEAAVALGVHDRFRAFVTGDQVQRRKPAPDVYLAAADRLGVPPARCVAIEDTGPGLAAALAAGMRAVVIPHWLTETHDFGGAHLRVGSAAELTVARLRALMPDE